MRDEDHETGFIPLNEKAYSLVQQFFGRLDEIRANVIEVASELDDLAESGHPGCRELAERLREIFPSVGNVLNSDKLSLEHVLQRSSHDQADEARDVYGIPEGEGIDDPS